MKFEKRLVFLFATLIFISMGCDLKSDLDGREYPNSLIVLPSASGVQESEIDGTMQLYYTVKDIYPASKSIGFIENQLESVGWTHLEYDDLNFNSPTAYVTGWISNNDQANGPGNEVHIWHSIWKNQDGDYVKYHFQYFSRTGHIKEQDSLTVAAIFIPSKVANNVKGKVKGIIEDQ